MRFIQNIKSMIETISPVIFASHIAEKELSNPSFTAASIFFCVLNLSLILSKIMIFASIAIPIDNTKPAIDASVNTIQNCFKIASVIAT